MGFSLIIAESSEEEFSISESLDELEELELRLLFCFVRVFPEDNGTLSDSGSTSLETGSTTPGGVCAPSTLVAALLGSTVICLRAFLSLVLAMRVRGLSDPIK